MRNVSHTEQMSLVLQYVNVQFGQIEEHFVRFLAVDKIEGEELTRCVLTEIKTFIIHNCQAKGMIRLYNIRGEYSGV